MARLTRLSPANIPQHIIQRGNNRQVCFANEQDYEAYISWLKGYAKKYQVEVHALGVDDKSCTLTMHSKTRKCYQSNDAIIGALLCAVF